jgi:hypothetical protein
MNDMPGNVRTPSDEKKWKRAKKHVAQSKGYPESEFKDQDWGLVQMIYQRIKAKSEEKTLNLTSVVTERKSRKRQKCSCYYGDCGACHRGWVFAPFYGKGDGKSDAAISTLPSQGSSPQSGALPGPGGINMPGIAPGPNSGMGPIGASKNFDSHLFFCKQPWPKGQGFE